MFWQRGGFLRPGKSWLVEAVQEKLQEEIMAVKFQKGKRASAVSVIGGADGPTSIFIAGKFRKPGLVERLRQRRYRKKKARAEASITAGTHTLDEVIQYLEEKYHAVKISEEKISYREQYHCLRESLILRWCPKLLGDAAKIDELNRTDKASLERFLKQTELRSEAAKAVTEEQFPMDFCLYKVSIPEAGRIEVMIEKKWGVLTCSYTGKAKKRLIEICRDVYLYYGVSKEDIQNKTERYQSLVMVLIME